MKTLKNVSKISRAGNKITSDVKGAVFVARSTGYSEVKTLTGREGLRKEHGCVWFRGGKNMLGGIFISQRVCEQRYLDKCPGSSAWLVIPVTGGFDWYRVDGEIKFSDMGSI